MTTHDLLLACSQEITVTRVSHKQVDAIRRDPEGRDIRSEFRRSARSTLPVHHIIPISLGGTHNPNNLACVTNYLHTAIHKFIDEQGPLSVGETAIRLIPRMWGKVWIVLPEVAAVYSDIFPNAALYDRNRHQFIRIDLL